MTFLPADRSFFLIKGLRWIIFGFWSWLVSCHTDISNRISGQYLKFEYKLLNLCLWKVVQGQGSICLNTV